MLILLDIDGVMVQAASWKRVEILNDGFTSFNARAVSGLQRIISETGATIVLTTSHKYKYNLEQWKDIFATRGINTTIDRLEDNLTFLNRKEEILRWYSNNKNVEDFIIIDDDKSLNGLPSNLKDKLVQTTPMIGLTEENVELAFNIFEKSLVY
jgi:diphthamide synthase subunit DPH2